MIQSIVAILFLALIVVPISLTIWLLIYAAHKATRLVGQCKQCGYDLRGLGERRACPECGRGFVVNQRGDVLS